MMSSGAVRNGRERPPLDPSSLSSLSSPLPSCWCWPLFFQKVMFSLHSMFFVLNKCNVFIQNKAQPPMTQCQEKCAREGLFHKR